MGDYDIVLCELVMSAAYIANEIDLVKETMLRVPPQSATSYMKSVYDALAKARWSSLSFRDALNNGNAITAWEMEKQRSI
jgi:hypothetical protein